MRYQPLLLAMLLLPGCGLTEFSDRATNPVVDDPIGLWFTGARYTTISTSAGRRIIFVRFADRRTGMREFVCAEPSPDALEVYANALAASAQGSGGPLGSAEFRRSFATAAQPMLYRSQGLQLLRDTMFHLCIMALNGLIDEKAYLQRLDWADQASATLIEKEMDAVRVAAGRAATPVKPGPVPLPPSPSGSTPPLGSQPTSASRPQSRPPPDGGTR
jgi:hypothetical protein